MNNGGILQYTVGECNDGYFIVIWGDASWHCPRSRSRKTATNAGSETGAPAVARRRWGRCPDAPHLGNPRQGVRPMPDRSRE
jgi:hypothetical protein